MGYHAFLSYNSKNLDDVRVLNDYLTNSGVKTFFDKTCIGPGDRFQEKIESGLRDSDSILVIIGADGLGPWQEEENYGYQVLSAGGATRGKKIIPVLLPGAHLHPERDRDPLLLQTRSEFVFHRSIDDKEDLVRLIEAIPRRSDNLGELERPFLRVEQDDLLTRTIAFYDANGEQYYEKWKDDLPLAPMGAFISELRKKPGKPRMLDAGCGPGHHSKWFAQNGCEVVGLDLSRTCLEIAGKIGIENSTILNGDMRDLQRVIGRRNYFDGVWACASCLHLSKEALSTQLYQFEAVLKPGGVLGLSLQVNAPSQVQNDGRFFERFEDRSLRSKLENHGFNIVNVNVQLSDQSTNYPRKVKKWLNLTAIASPTKERMRLASG